MAEDFEECGCALVSVGQDLHQLVARYKSRVIAAGGNYFAPEPWDALNDIYKASRVVPFPMFVTVGGTFTHADLVGMRIVGCNAEGLPLDPTTSEITLDPVTGTVTSVVEDGRHWLIIGNHLDIWGDNDL